MTEGKAKSSKTAHCRVQLTEYTVHSISEPEQQGSVECMSTGLAKAKG